MPQLLYTLPHLLRREVRAQVNGNLGATGIQHTVNMSLYASAVSNLSIAESPVPSVRYVGRFLAGFIHLL